MPLPTPGSISRETPKFHFQGLLKDKGVKLCLLCLQPHIMIPSICIFLFYARKFLSHLVSPKTVIY